MQPNAYSSGTLNSSAGSASGLICDLSLVNFVVLPSAVLDHDEAVGQ